MAEVRSQRAAQVWSLAGAKRIALKKTLIDERYPEEREAARVALRSCPQRFPVRRA